MIQFDPEVNTERLRSLGRQKELESRRLKEEIQAFEAREDSYHARVRASYAQVLSDAAARGPVAEIDASGSLEAVRERVLHAVAHQFEGAL